MGQMENSCLVTNAHTWHTCLMPLPINWICCHCLGLELNLSENQGGNSTNRFPGASPLAHRRTHFRTNMRQTAFASHGNGTFGADYLDKRFYRRSEKKGIQGKPEGGPEHQDRRGHWLNVRLAHLVQASLGEKAGLVEVSNRLVSLAVPYHMAGHFQSPLNASSSSFMDRQILTSPVM